MLLVDRFIKQCAADKINNLARLLSQERFARHKVTAEVVDGEDDDLHAEMRLLEHHLKARKPLNTYVGISMLCCAHCTWVMKQLDVHGYRGSSAYLFGNWVLSKLFHEDESRFRKLLGSTVCAEYDKICSCQFRMEGDPKDKKTEGKLIARKIISALKGLNDKDTLENLCLPDSDYYEEPDTLTALDPLERQYLPFEKFLEEVTKRSCSSLKQLLLKPCKTQSKAPLLEKLKIVDKGAGGDCLFKAISSQLPGVDFDECRQLAVAALRSNEDDYAWRINGNTVDTLRYIDGEGNMCDEIYNSFSRYLELMSKPGTWGGQIECAVLAQVLARPICLVIDGYLPLVFPSAYDVDNRPNYDGEPIFIYYNGANHYQAMLPESAVVNTQQIMQALLNMAPATVAINTESLDNILFNAALCNDLHAVITLLKQGASVNSKHVDIRNDYGGKTPLFIAAEMGHYEVMKLLINNGADPNIRDDGNWSPYDVALVMEHQKGRASCTPCVLALKDRHLFEAARNGDVDATVYWLGQGANIDSKHTDRCIQPTGEVYVYREKTPLFIAAEKGHHEIVKLLIERGANPRMRDAGFWRPYDVALVMEHQYGKKECSPCVLTLQEIS